ncbi:MAG: methyltetrahydrofolate--corrinoid methyltransferase [Chloroflexi bacterium]|nr:MAG: methyltetrahydrofolate--corrinoid methyltransferase [Chloroflexota bacterium]
MNTVVKSPTKTVLIGPDQPFVIIGERINPTGRKKLEAEMLAGDFSRVLRDAQAQIAAGAHILDVNAGVTSVNPQETEPAIMVQCVELVQSVTDVPLCIDSSVVPALIAGLKAAKGRPIVNSVTGEEERLEAILPVVAEYNVPVIGICNDESGISYDPKVRLAVAKKIVVRAESYGIKREDLLLDPLAMPVGAVNTAGIDLFTIVRMIREELGCNTVCGASNISFGLPNRHLIDSVFIPMAIAAGMTCAITNPLEKSIRHAIYAADVLMGHDESCQRYLTAMREAQASERAGNGATLASADRRAARDARRAARSARQAEG